MIYECMSSKPRKDIILLVFGCLIWKFFVKSTLENYIYYFDFTMSELLHYCLLVVCCLMKDLNEPDTKILNQIHILRRNDCRKTLSTRSSCYESESRLLQWQTDTKVPRCDLRLVYSLQAQSKDHTANILSLLHFWLWLFWSPAKGIGNH